MNCQKADILIQKSLDGALMPAQRAALDRHMAACAACRVAWEEYHQLVQVTGAWAQREASASAPGDAFTECILAHIAAPSPSATPGRSGFRLLTACVAFVSLVSVSILVWPALFQALPPVAPLPLSCPTVSDVSEWLAANLGALPALAMSGWESLRMDFAGPVWLPGALAFSVLSNVFLYLRAARSSQRRIVP